MGQPAFPVSGRTAHVRYAVKKGQGKAAAGLSRFMTHRPPGGSAIRVGMCEIEAVATVTAAMPCGVLFTYFLSPPNPFNALAHRVAAPITNNYRYKLDKAKVARVGESPYKKDRRVMSFQRRDFGRHHEGDQARFHRRRGRGGGRSDGDRQCGKEGGAGDGPA